jgi:hypothetical protein
MGVISCKLGSGSYGPAAEFAGARAFQLRLNPAPGSSYSYDIFSRQDYKFELADKKIDNESKVDASVNYSISKDSAGDFVFLIRYGKVHIYSKNGDDESELDAANAANSGDPVEQLLGNLKDANISAILSPTGQVKSVSGFKEMFSRYMAQFTTANTYQLAAVKQRWESTIGDQLVRRNMDQLFGILPDSSIHIGDKWHLNPSQKGELGLETSTTFTLTDIRDRTAFIESEGTIKADSTAAQFMNYNVTTDLKGTQKGEYQIDVRTGMLLGATVGATVEGSLQTMGREIPLTIESQIKVKGH